LSSYITLKYGTRGKFDWSVCVDSSISFKGSTCIDTDFVSLGGVSGRKPYSF